MKNNETKEFETIIKGCVIFPLGLVLAMLIIVAGCLIEGYVLTWLWEWFVADYFFLPSLSLWMAVGFCLISNLLFSKVRVERPKEYDILWGTALSHVFVRPWILLGLGYLIKTWLMV